MSRLPTNIPYEAWLDYVFAPVDAATGMRRSGDDWWDEKDDPALAVNLLTRLFEEPEVLLDRYTHERINRGLWFLVFESGNLSALLEPLAPWPDRRRGLLGIGSLYARLFARACANHLGHLERGPELPDPINSICYMWWDLFPTWGGSRGQDIQEKTPSRRARRRARNLARAEGGSQVDKTEAALLTVDDVLLTVMTRTLRLESEACREGALHGLGHWQRHYPGRVEAIIDEWLSEAPHVSPELRQYAEAARRCCVL